jgi:hypothetical protein
MSVHVGIGTFSGQVPTDGSQDVADAYADMLTLAEEAEAAGFDSFSAQQIPHPPLDGSEACCEAGLVVAGTRQRNVDDPGDPAGGLRRHDNPVSERHRLIDVMGDEHRRLPELGEYAEEEVTDPDPGLRIQGAEGLVHQENGRLISERSRQPLRPRMTRNSPGWTVNETSFTASVSPPACSRREPPRAA